MTASSPFKPCNSIGCESLIPRALLMCPTHWRRVPSALQAEVHSALSAWKNKGGSLRPYLIATKKAILAVAAHLGPECENGPAATKIREELERLEGLPPL
jgi:hypothetical protein